MLKLLKTAGVASALSLAAISANAATIEGDLTFAGVVLVPTTDYSVTGGVDIFGDAGFTTASSGDFAGVSITSVFDIDFDAPGTLFELSNGVSFVASAFVGLVDGAFSAIGTLTGGIFDDTAATLDFASGDFIPDALDFYTADVTITDGSVAPVPLPAAGFLLVGALGGLTVAGRRKAKKA